jgi:RND superfamily putative drug exporter
VLQRRRPVPVPEPPPPFLWRLYGTFTAYVGPLLLVAWIAACAATVLLLPDFSTGNQSLLQILPGNSPALQAQAREVKLFGAALGESEAVVVESDPHGLPSAAIAAGVRRAVAVDTAHPGTPQATRPVFAIPVVNARGLVPASGGRAGTTLVTYLAFPSSAGSGDVVNGAHAYAASLPHPAGAEVGVTGPVPAQIAEGNAIEDSLTLVEAVTVAVIALLVGFVFRSPIAPVVPLSGSAIAYLVSRHLIGWGARAFGLAVPSQLDPVMVVLLLGVVTDYSIFTLTGMQERLRSGERRTVALRRSAARVVPLIIAAALTVAAGTVSLIAADIDFFHALGPGLAISVVVAGLVAITWVPALSGVLGRLAFWPGLSHGRAPRPTVASPSIPDPRPPVAAPGVRMRIARILSHRLGAAVVAIVCLAAIAACGSGLVFARLGTDILTGLAPGSGPLRAEQSAGSGFSAGIVAPTTLILQSPGIAAHTASLARLEGAIARSPGVAGVIGPSQVPIRGLAPVFRTASGNAVRIITVFRSDPYDAPAISALSTLQSRLPTDLRSAGLGSPTAAWSGATPASAEAASASAGNVWRVALLAALLMTLVLVIAFRAVVAPLLLVLSSAAALAAPLGLLVYVFQDLLGYPDITFFVPIAGGVLLAALGADYSVFVMGRIWEDAHGQPVSSAVLAALPRAGRAITIAALTLACSFAVLALVPVEPFREFAFLIAVGVLIDAFAVRSFLLPALLVLAGRHAFWPRRSLGVPVPPPPLQVRTAEVGEPASGWRR